MPTITVTENEDVFLEYPLKYGLDWSVVAQRKTSVQKGQTSAVYFYVAATEGGTPWLTLSDASSTQIAWLDSTRTESSASTNTTVRVKLGSNTGGHVGIGQFFELRIKFTDGSYISARQGTFNVVASQVDRP